MYVCDIGITLVMHHVLLQYNISISFLTRDHASGNEKLVSLVPGLTVCGNDDRIGAMNKRVKHSDQFNVRVVCIVVSHLFASHNQ